MNEFSTLLVFDFALVIFEIDVIYHLSIISEVLEVRLEVTLVIILSHLCALQAISVTLNKVNFYSKSLKATSVTFKVTLNTLQVILIKFNIL